MRLKKNEDNVKNQLNRTHKGMKDIQTKRRYNIDRQDEHIHNDILNCQGRA